MRIATTGVCAGLAMTGFFIMKDSMIFKMSVRIYQDENKVFGPGIAQLLHRVRELRSLRAAASSMNMAYSKAWTVLRTAENALGYKLLYSSAGGKNGGGAVLTPQGEKLLEQYDEFCRRMQAYGQAQFAQLFCADEVSCGE